MEKSKREERCVCAWCIRGFAFIPQWCCYFKSLLKLVPPAGFFWWPKSVSAFAICFRISIHKLCWSPAGFPQWKMHKQNPQHVGLGAPNPTPCSLQRTHERREAIRPNNLTPSPNCFLLLTKEPHQQLWWPSGKSLLVMRPVSNPFITVKCWQFVSTNPISVNQ